MIKLTEIRQSIGGEEIAQLEEKYNIMFPEQYKYHLLRYNGGVPEKGVFSFYEEERLTDSRVSFFYAINSGLFDDLESVIVTYKIDQKRIPSKMLPIAEDPFGNVVCISFDKIDYGYIYFWDHEKEVDNAAERRSNYYGAHLISRSFNDFLASMREKK